MSIFFIFTYNKPLKTVIFTDAIRVLSPSFHHYLLVLVCWCWICCFLASRCCVLCGNTTFTHSFTKKKMRKISFYICHWRRWRRKRRSNISISFYNSAQKDEHDTRTHNAPAKNTENLWIHYNTYFHDVGIWRVRNSKEFRIESSVYIYLTNRILHTERQRRSHQQIRTHIFLFQWENKTVRRTTRASNLNRNAIRRRRRKKKRSEYEKKIMLCQWKWTVSNTHFTHKVLNFFPLVRQSFWCKWGLDWCENGSFQNTIFGW